MRLTRAASRALLRQHQNDPDEHQSSLRTTIPSLPNEVLLEIFDAFRQTFQREYRFERAWNSNKGWFKLAHVCQEWRQVVLTSPSRLHIRLLFTKHRSGRSIAIRRLPLLPIVVDYNYGAMSAKTQISMISALAYPDRVCGFAFNTYIPQTKHSSKLLAAMDQPFPALESLEIYCLGSKPPPFPTGQVPHLRRLKYGGFITDFYRILPYTTSLVDLSFRLHMVTSWPLETHLLVHLQGLSSLRRLEVEMRHIFRETPPRERGEVLLPNLTFFSFTGALSVLDALITDLAAPSLRVLRISIVSRVRAPPPTLLPTHLISFIRNAGRQFFSTRFDISKRAMNIVMSTHPRSTDNLPFRIIASGVRSIPLMNHLLSEALVTVEDVLLSSPFDLKSLTSPFEDPVHRHTFFTPFHSAKIIRLSPGIEQEIGDIFRHEELPLDLLPSLEQIVLNAITRSCTTTPMDESQVASFLELFKPFVDARQQAGHIVKVHWNADRVLPGYFCDTDI